jgi:Fervidolysin N-terminal prodomain
VACAAGLAGLAAPGAWSMGVRSGGGAGAGADGGMGGTGKAGPPPPAYVQGEVVVQFRAGVTAGRIAALLAELGLAPGRPAGVPGFIVARIVDGSSVPEAIRRLQARPEVESAEPNYLTRLAPPERGPRPQPIAPRA